MNKPLALLLSILFIFIIINVNTVDATLGTFKQNDCVQIRTILNTTGVTLSTLSYPNNTLIVSGKPMTAIGKTFNYTTCSTSALGSYTYDYNDTDGNVYVNDFLITTTGNNKITMLPIFLLIAGFALLALGIYKQVPLIGLSAGVLVSIAGVYFLIYGLGTIQNVYTQAIAYVGIFLGLAVAFAASYEWYNIGSINGEEEEE